MRPENDLRVLDNPVWHALTGAHARFAEAVGTARRYDPDVSIFAALPDDHDAGAWLDLANLVGPDAAVLVSATGLDAPAGWVLATDFPGVQLVDEHVDATPDPEAIVLGPSDVDEMAELVARTQPGPWRPRTHELGNYLGIRDEGRLVAMAGERLHPPGWTEISAVCTDPDHRGQGLAGRLVRAVVHGIRARGDRAMMHAAATNTNAIRLYESLGFEVRCAMTFAGYLRPSESTSD